MQDKMPKALPLSLPPPLALFSTRTEQNGQDNKYHTQVGLTVCGGYYDVDKRNCETFVDGHWNISHNLLEPRSGHSMWQSPEGILLMGGDDSSSYTTELLQVNGTSVDKFRFPYRLRYDVGLFCDWFPLVLDIAKLQYMYLLGIALC